MTDSDSRISQYSEGFSDDKLQSLIAELQEELVQEQDKRQEERFAYIAILIVLLNIVFFTVMPNAGGPIALLVLELVLLIPLAKRMGLEEMAKIIDRVLGSLSQIRKGD